VKNQEQQQRYRFTHDIKKGLRLTSIGIRATAELALENFKKSELFILPPNGELIGDGLKGLPSNLRLPFPITSMYFLEAPTPYDGNLHLHASIVIVEETDGVGFGIYSFGLIGVTKNTGTWRLLPFMSAMGNTIIPTKDGNATKLTTIPLDGVEATPEMTAAFGASVQRVTLELIEALSCSNVTHEKHARAKSTKKGEPLMYDEYRTLVIEIKGAKSAPTNASEGSSGRTPREHLRRGHIHSYHTNNGIIKHWINSVIVNAGVGGKITKVYKPKKGN
jgi:hypothetical protein